MVTTAFPTFQAAADAPNKRPLSLVLINGIPTEYADYSTVHAVTQPVGTATIVLPPMEVPDHIQVGATVEIQAGYTGLAAVIFQGILPAEGIEWDDNGTVATLNAVSYGTWLARKDFATVSFPGPVPGKTLYQSLAARRGVPSAWADDMVTPDGSQVIQFGVTPDYEGGEVVIPRKTQSESWLNGLFNLFGYYVFDLPSGPNRLQAVSGRPNTEPVATFEQGVTGYGYGVRNDMTGMVTFWEVFGARYTESDTGLPVQIRSIPFDVDPEPILGPDQYVRDEKSHNQLVTTELADIVRNVLETDYSTPRQLVTWDDEGSPHIQPGDVVHVTAPSIRVDADLWVMRVRHTDNDQSGFTTTFEGWAGNGEPRAPGQDCVSIDVFTGPIHMGDERIPWYAVPTPSPGPIVIPFTVPDYYSSIGLTCLCHGSNSFMRGGKNDSSTVSRFEVHQFGEKVGEGALPTLDENYAQRLAYGDPAHPEYWSELPIAITGSLKPGAAQLHIIPGVDTRLPLSTRKDDFEVKDGRLRLCGVGMPILPNEVAA